MLGEKEHYGKVILYGEYTVINTGEALAIPLRSIKGHLDDTPPSIAQSIKYLKAFARYLKTLDLPYNVDIDTQSLDKDIKNGLYLDTNATIGYGVGSSGILTAAVFSKYANLKSKLSLQELKDVLAQMESFFHGNSSGVDPLISYMGMPLHMQNNCIELLDGIDSEVLSSFYLIDSGIPRNTQPLVQWFRKEMEEEVFAEAIDHLSSLVSEAIQATIMGDIEELTLSLKQLSAHQLVHLNRLIPESLMDLWMQGLESDDYYMKLCGAGGGGYMLIYKVNELPKSDHKILPVI